MAELLGNIFPESEATDDVLCGLIDATDGHALNFFTHLAKDEREIVQWYVSQSILPFNAEGYAIELAKGYAIVDPNRVHADAMESAHAELGRLETFLDIFVGSKDFFPIIGKFNISTRDESGNLAGSIDVDGWDNVFAYSRVAGIAAMKADVRSRSLPIIKMTQLFIDDPRAVPRLFDQEKILRDHQLKMQS